MKNRTITMSFLRYSLMIFSALGVTTSFIACSSGQDSASSSDIAVSDQEQMSEVDASSTPRTANDRPDLNGRWGSSGGGGSVMAIEPDGTEYNFDTFADYQAAVSEGSVSLSASIIGRRPNYRHGNNVYGERDDGMTRRYFANPPLYKGEFWNHIEYLDINGNMEDMTFICMPAGVPRMGPPIRILQSESDVVFLYQQRNTWRVIPTDGRDHDPLNSQDQTFMGDSVGRWEGDTLIVDVVGFNDLTWLGWPGWYHTNEMRVEERFTRIDDTLLYEVTVHDPEVLSEPWEMDPRVLNLNASTATYLEDPPCLDFDSAHMVTRERG